MTVRVAAPVDLLCRGAHVALATYRLGSLVRCDRFKLHNMLFELTLRKIYLSFFFSLGEIIQTFIIMHNYETMLVIILGN